jgi:hypothetical protein
MEEIMSLSALSLQKNATSMTCVGGTAMPLEVDGVEVKNGVHLSDMGEADFTVRTNATFKTRPPQRLADGTYTKLKNDITIVCPEEIADGSIVFNLVRISSEIHPKSAGTSASNVHLLGSQALSDSDCQNFLLYGSLK